MSDQLKRISRELFYERIWTTPIVQLGKELGYSYLEMVQLCQQLKVPRPDGGYWYRRKRGGAEERMPLPPAEADTPVDLKYGPRFQAQPEAGKLETDVTPAPVASAAQDASNQPPELTAPAAKRKSSSVMIAKPAPEPTPQPAPPVTSVKYTRRELYDAIWSMSCQKLAASLGISDVGLAKTCKRLGIPRPSLGYWARVAVGEKVPQTPLPAAQPGQDKTITFDVAANQRRREEWRSTQIDVQDLAVELTLPGEDVALHPLAEKHQRALEKKKPDEGGLVHLQVQELFRCDVTPATVTRLCRALHALFVELAARGYKFKSGAEPYSNLSIIKGDDKVTICCMEGQEQIERSPTAEDKRKPSWEWRLKETKPTGRLSFEVHGLGLRGRRTWTESDGKPLEEILGIVVEKVDAVFRGFEEQRRLEAELAKRREENEKRAAEERVQEQKRQAERDRIQRHQAKLSEIVDTRRENLLHAAQTWMDSESLYVFIDACEQRWRKAGELPPEKMEWLAWAREEAAKMHPFTKGYPDPIEDGPFDPSSVPMGGPYPKTKALSQKKPPEPAPPEVRTVYVREPQQYQYWLRNRPY